MKRAKLRRWEPWRRGSLPPPWIRAAWESFRRRPELRRLRLPSWHCVVWRPDSRFLMVPTHRRRLVAMEELVEHARPEAGFEAFVARTCKTIEEELAVRGAYAGPPEVGSAP